MRWSVQLGHIMPQMPWGVSNMGVIRQSVVVAVCMAGMDAWEACGDVNPLKR